MSPFNLVDPVLTATSEHALGRKDWPPLDHEPLPNGATFNPHPHEHEPPLLPRQYSYADMFGMSPLGQDGFPQQQQQQQEQAQQQPTPPLGSTAATFGFGQQPQHRYQTMNMGASDSSEASSPDIASLLPPRHHWNSPSSGTPHLPQTPTAPGHSLPGSKASPVNNGHLGAVSAPSWFGLTGYDHGPTGADVNALATEWARGGHDFDPSVAVPDGRGDHFRHLPYHQIGGLPHFYGHGHGMQPGLHASRHHPYMSPESSLADRHRTLGDMSSSAPSSLTTEPPRPVKSGRLGVKRRQKYTRSRTGCLGCRARRIKCDEGRPVCRRCIVAKRESDCIFPDHDQSEGGKKAQGSKHAESTDEDFSSPEHNKKPLSPEDQYATLYGTTASGHQHSSALGDSLHLKNDLDQLKVDTSAGPPLQPNGLGIGIVNLGFDLTHAIPEGFGVTGQLGWERSFTSEMSPAFGLEPPRSNASGASDSVLGFIGDTTPSSANATVVTPPPLQVTGLPDGGAIGSPGAGAQNSGESHGTAIPPPVPPLLTAPNFLLPWFPTIQEQSLIFHFCANAADLMMAIPVGLNPMLAVNLPLALAWPRGTNAACDALRITLLGIAAVHQAFLLARGGVNTAQTRQAFQLASKLRNMGKEMVQWACATSAAASSDAVLSASTGLVTIDIFFGGFGWQDNLALAKRMVASRGGPRAMLKASTPTALGDGTSVTAVRLSLEILAIYETFASLTKGSEPELLNDDADSEGWWFASSGSTFEQHSVENQFGMSRVMIHLFSRVARLLARKRLVTGYLREPLVPVGPAECAVPGPAPQCGAGSRRGSAVAGSGSRRASAASTVSSVSDASWTMSTGSLSQLHSHLAASAGPRFADPWERTTTHGIKAVASLPAAESCERAGGPKSTTATASDEVNDEAACLKRDIDAWIESLASAPGDEHERVQVGNKAYAYTMRILLLRMVSGRRRTDALVQKSALAVLQYCSISTAALGMGIDLMWPAVVAGCCLSGGDRKWLETLLQGFQAQCCFDVETASRIIKEVWRRVDGGDESADWKVVCDDLGLPVLLC